MNRQHLVIGVTAFIAAVAGSAVAQARPAQKNMAGSVKPGDPIGHLIAQDQRMQAKLKAKAQADAEEAAAEANADKLIERIAGVSYTSQEPVLTKGRSIRTKSKLTVR